MRGFQALLPILLAALVAVAPLCAEDAPATEPPRLEVRVDPRVELMSVIFRFAGHPEYQRARVPAYAAAVDRHFAAFREHEVVKAARRLRAERGVSYDAPMSLAVHLSQPPALAPRVDLDPRPASLDSRWRADEAQAFLALARDFVKATDFEAFLAAHAGLHAAATARMEAFVAERLDLSFFDRFYGARPGSRFTVVLGMLNGPGNYGPRAQLSDGTEELYAVIGVEQVDEGGVPTYGDGTLHVLVHEFSHSYVNPLVERHVEALRPAGEALYALVSEQMQSQAYGNAETMLKESLVRAVTIRYAEVHSGVAAVVPLLQNEVGLGFLWMPELYAQIGRYEASRETWPTFADFMGECVAFFEAAAPRHVAAERALEARRPRLVSSVPTRGARDVDPALARMVFVFDRPMRDRSWSVVGGGPEMPALLGPPAYDESRTRLEVPVRLESDHAYRFWLNRGPHQGFQADDGTALAPVEIAFRTGSASAAGSRPRVVALTPENGATDVDPSLGVILVGFDRPMQDQSWSVVGGGPEFPELAGKPSYDEARRVLSIPVRLRPGHAYRFWLNRGEYQGFVSEDGVALASVEVTFRTRAE